DRVTFDGIADLKFAVAFDTDTAFHAGADFVDLVLEAAQRLHDAFVNDVLAPAHAHFAAHDASAADHAAGDRRALGQLKNLPHFRRTNDIFLDDRIKQAGQGILHLVNQLINDGVKFDLHAGVFRLLGGGAVHARVETEDDALRGGRERHVVFGDGADIA